MATMSSKAICHLTIIGLQNVVKKGGMLQPISCLHAGRCLTNLHEPMVFFPPEPGKVKLLDRVRETMRFKHYSLRTERTYIDWIKRFIIYHGKGHPETMAELEKGRSLFILRSPSLPAPFSFCREPPRPRPRQNTPSSAVPKAANAHRLKCTKCGALRSP
jgi:hypothetical protein